MTVTPRKKPINSGTKEMKKPYRKEANISPSNIAHTVTGVVINLSKVRPRASNGMIAGPIDIEEK
jgi:hypothetical protein